MARLYIRKRDVNTSWTTEVGHKKTVNSKNSETAFGNRFDCRTRKSSKLF